MSGPRLVAGIDEAGLGPLLGPLTLGYSVLSLPTPDTNVWEALANVVAPAPARGEKRILVADSKKVYSRNPRGRERLETTALTFLAQRSVGAPRSGEDLLRCAAPPLRPRAADVARHPWYTCLPQELPMWTDPGRLELRTEALRLALDAASIAIVEAGVRVIPAGELNRSFRQTRNKSTTVWALLGMLLTHFWQEYGHHTPHIIIDRQGGRFRYGHLLGRLFPEARVHVGPEAPKQSEYRVEAAPTPAERPRCMRLTFAEKAEDRAFGVALGSCLAKYGRELAMESFNSYFHQLQPDLAPTAGYTQDGRRWVEDARATLEANKIDPDVLIRQR